MGRARVPLSAAILAALIGAVLLTLPRAAAVWGAGEFHDPDDAMRAVQIRDLLAGQSWFDMSAHRLDPPAGVFMHWSRIVDAPLAGLELLFRAVMDAPIAERVARLVFPLACLAALLAVCAETARRLAGPSARLPAVFLVLLSAPMFAQFTPGRIDHHAPQIVLLCAGFGLLAAGFDPRRRVAAALAALPLALSLAISLENLPFFAVLLAAPPILFLLDGEERRGLLAAFALGLLVFLPLTFAATIAPSRYNLSVCDAYSAAHLRAALVGALGLAALARAAPRLSTIARRAAGVALVAAAALAAFLASAPPSAGHCLGDPLGGLDPLLRELWLAHVTEARSLAAFVDEPALLVSAALPVLLGFAAALVLALREQAVARRRWAMLAAAILVGFCAGLWQIRVFSSVTPLAMIALAGATAALHRRLAAVTPALRGLALGVLCLAVSPMGLALALQTEAEAPPPGASARACLDARAYDSLARLPAARIVAPIDLGAHLLAFTPHFVFAAPYHRDNHGNRVAVDAFLADPGEAERLLRAANVDLLLWCAGGETIDALRQRAPLGLAARLARGESPPWAREIPLAGTPFHLFALRPPQ